MIININSTILKAINYLNNKNLNTLFITDKNKRVVGSFSLGDFRKCIDKNISLKSKISKAMNRNFKFAPHPPKKKEIIKIFKKNINIFDLVVLNRKKKFLNILKRQDFIKNKINKTPVVIMAGGKGTRLRPLTNVIPKALIPINNIPLTDKIIQNFFSQRFRNFFITINENKDLIKAYFKNQKKYSINFVEEKSFLGTVGSIELLKKKIKQDFFLTNCDLILNSNYEEILDFHKKKKNLITIVVAFKSVQYPYGVCITKKDSLLKTINEKPIAHNLTSVGFYILSPKVFKYLKKNQSMDMDQLIKKILKAKKSIRVFPVQENSWRDFGTWDQYQANLYR